MRPLSTRRSRARSVGEGWDTDCRIWLWPGEPGGGADGVPAKGGGLRGPGAAAGGCGCGGAGGCGG